MAEPPISILSSLFRQEHTRVPEAWGHYAVIHYRKP